MNKRFLWRVTLTGADDQTNPNDLVRLSNLYPFVEWGILMSINREGTPKYPKLSWVEQLKGLGLTLCCHVCGKWSRDLATGGHLFRSDCSHLTPLFSRMQLNISHMIHTVDIRDLTMGLLLFSDKQIIIQAKSLNIWNGNLNDNMAVLFDRSGGRGVLPSSWPKPTVKCGYAGGLNPDNVVEQLELISNVIDDKRTWVDAETGIRTGNRFDLDKAKAFLEAAKPYVD